METSTRLGSLVFISSVCCISGFMFGYDTAVISGASLYLYSDLGPSTTVTKEVVVSVILLGTVVGALG